MDVVRTPAVSSMVVVVVVSLRVVRTLVVFPVVVVVVVFLRVYDVITVDVVRTLVVFSAAAVVAAPPLVEVAVSVVQTLHVLSQ